MLKNLNITNFLLPSLLLLLFLQHPILGFDRSGKEDDFDKILRIRRNFLTGGHKLDKKDPEIRKKTEMISSLGIQYWNSMDKRLWRSFLWSDLSNSSLENVLKNYERLKSIALAYSIPGSALYKEKKLKTDIIFALEWLYKNYYNETLKLLEKEQKVGVLIGIELNDIIVLINKDLSKDEKHRLIRPVFEIFPSLNDRTEPVVNALKSWMYTLSSSVIKNSGKLDSALFAFKEITQYVTKGNGFYSDGSFLIDKSSLNGAEGIDVLSMIANTYFALQETSKMALLGDKEHLFDLINKAFIPIVSQYKISDIVKGEEMVIPKAEAKRNSQLAESCLLLLATFKNDLEIKHQLRPMIQLVELKESLSRFSVQSIMLYKENIQAKEKDILSIKIYPSMDRLIMHTPQYSCGISMFSNRTINYENREGFNSKGWYTSYGYTSVAFNEVEPLDWSTVDPYKIPGTTITKLRTEEGGQSGKTNLVKWAGGAEINGKYGCAGMELQDVASSLFARKSWFLFDNEIVALGTGIKCSDNFEVVSIIENRKININSTSLFINGEETSVEEFTPAIFDDAEWMYLRSSKDTMGIGYVFPQYSPIASTVSKGKILKTDAEKSDSEDVYFSLTINHGKKPTQGSYQYILLPGITIDSLGRYDQNPDVIILQNNNEIHAVREKNLNLIAANFWTEKSSTLSIDGSLTITCDKPVALLLREKDNEAELSISDPTQNVSGIVHVEIVNSRILDLIAADSRIKIFKDGNLVRLSIDLTKTNGASQSFSMKLSDNIVKE